MQQQRLEVRRAVFHASVGPLVMVSLCEATSWGIITHLKDRAGHSHFIECPHTFTIFRESISTQSPVTMLLPSSVASGKVE